MGTCVNGDVYHLKNFFKVGATDQRKIQEDNKKLEN